jgi:hypothetical protein
VLVAATGTRLVDVVAPATVDVTDGDGGDRVDITAVVDDAAPTVEV